MTNNGLPGIMVAGWLQMRVRTGALTDRTVRSSEIAVMAAMGLTLTLVSVKRLRALTLVVSSTVALLSRAAESTAKVSSTVATSKVLASGVGKWSKEHGLWGGDAGAEGGEQLLVVIIAGEEVEDESLGDGSLTELWD